MGRDGLAGHPVSTGSEPPALCFGHGFSRRRPVYRAGEGRKDGEKRSEESRIRKQDSREPERYASAALDPLLRFRVDSDRRAATRQDIPAGELVRSGAVAAAEDRLGESPPATLSAGHAALIEAIYRSVYVMVTLKRQELLDDERGEELDDLVAAAHRTMTETMNEGPA